MSLINTTFFGKNKNSSGGSGGFTRSTNITNVKNVQSASEADRLSEEHLIWSQPFDGTKDITGDFLIDNNNKMEIYGPWKAGSYYAKELSYVQFSPTANAAEHSNFYFRRTDVEMTDSPISMNSNDSSNSLLLAVNGILMRQTNNTVNLTSAGIAWSGNCLIHSDGEMTISAQKININLGNGDIRANSAYFNNIYDNGTGSIYFGSPVIFDEGMTLNGDLHVQDIYSQNITNEHMIKTKDLTVTGQMSVFDLVIEQVSAAGGQVILSAAQFHVDDFATGRDGVPASVNYGVAGSGQTDNYYKTIYLYQINEDQNGQKIKNQWQVGDHALCYTANVDQSTSLIDIRSWWTLVINTGVDVIRTIGGESKKCNMIEVVTEVSPVGGSYQNPSWGNVHVEIGDDICLLGSYNQDRRSAIVMCAHRSFDNNLEAPMIAQYNNIEGFTLTGKSTTYLAKNGNKITGSLVVASTGQDIMDIINGIQQGYQVYIHRAYANDDQGTDFVRYYDGLDTSDYTWIGFCSDYEPDDSTYTYDKYSWTKIKGEQGEGSEQGDFLISVRERLFLGTDDKLYLDCCYYTGKWDHSNNYITAYIYNYAGQSTTRNVNSRSGDYLSYTAAVQNDWSEVASDNRYAYARINLYNASGSVIDSHAIQITFDPGAVLSITDTIKARVSDAEGNISTLTQTATSLSTRLQDAEGNISTLTQTSTSLSAKIDTLQGRVDMIIDPTGITADIQGVKDDVNQLKIDVSGLKQTTSTMQTTIDGLVDKDNEFEVGINGLSNRTTQVETAVSNIDGAQTEIRNQVSELSQRIDGMDFTVKDVIVGGDNILNMTDWGVMSNDDVKASWVNGCNWQQNHSNGRLESVLIGKSKNGPLADGTAGYFECMSKPTNVSPSRDIFITASNGDKYVELMQQDITGRLKPSTWYTLSFYSMGFPSHRTMLSFIYPSVGNPNYKIYANGVDCGYCASDCNHSWTSADTSKTTITNNGWRRYNVTFKTRDDLSVTASHYILFRGYSDTVSGVRQYPTFYISQPKLEEGNCATQYTYSKHDWESNISIRANQITMNVRDGLKNTGIDIESGKINFNADNANFHGNINLYQQELGGITCYDTSGTPRISISPDSIGSTPESTTGQQVSGRMSTNTIYGSAGSSWNLTTEKISIGTVQSGSTIDISKLFVFFNSRRSEDSTFISGNGSTSLTGYIYAGTSQVKTFSCTLYMDYPTTYNFSQSGSTSWKHTAASTAEYFLQFNITNNKGAKAGYVPFGHVTFSYSYGVSHLTKIGNDGMIVAPGDTNYMWCGMNDYTVKYGNNIGVRLTQNNMYRIAAWNKWVPFDNYRATAFLNGTSPWNQYYCMPQMRNYYGYQIDPNNGAYRYIVQSCCAYGGEWRETWIFLPPCQNLPIGWEVEIINGMTNDSTFNNATGRHREGLYVSTTYLLPSTPSYKNVIYDANGNGNRYAELNGPQAHDRYIWDGYCWISMHDTQ